MKVLMTGGTGFLGSALRRRLESEGHDISVLSRHQSRAEGRTTFLPFEGLANLEPHDAVINLAGEPVLGLWTSKKRRAIYDSRIDTTRQIAAWIDSCEVKPQVFLSGSAVGIYGDRGSEELTERSDVSRAEGFLAKVCRDWEQAASSVAWRGTRVVLLRTGQVFDPSGGFLKTALPMLKRLPIVVLGDRGAYLPWISLSDWVEMVMFALQAADLNGPLNVTAPQPATQEEFSQAVASYLKKRVWGRVPAWLIRVAAGEFGRSITASERVVPAKALSLRFDFQCTDVAMYFRTLENTADRRVSEIGS